jgi:hypothetical protein
VKFYHFTQSRRLERIREEGLRPMPEEERNFIFPLGDHSPDNVVWLTSRPTIPAFYTDHIDADCPVVRITVSLSPKNRRLHHWKAWLQKHMPDVFAAHDVPDNDDDWTTFWFYEGTIKKFVAVEDVDDTMNGPFIPGRHRWDAPDDDEAPGTSWKE